ncbi:unnamed protein product, partial [Phaeothamnion confervicola]
CLSAEKHYKGDGGRSAKLPLPDGDGGGALALTPADAVETLKPADGGVLTLPPAAATRTPAACLGFSEEAQRRSLQLHQRVCHPGDGVVERLVRRGRLALDFEYGFGFCEPCVPGKSVKADAGKAGAQQRASAPWGLVYMDM